MPLKRSILAFATAVLGRAFGLCKQKAGRLGLFGVQLGTSSEARDNIIMLFGGNQLWTYKLRTHAS